MPKVNTWDQLFYYEFHDFFKYSLFEFERSVTIVHIKGTAKNAADEKLRQSIRRFADENKERPSNIPIFCLNH